MSKTTISKTNGYIIEITDAEGYRHYPIEGADTVGKTTIERADSPALYRGYQIVYTAKPKALKAIPIVRTLAQAKGERSMMPDSPSLPVVVRAIPYWGGCPRLDEEKV